MAQTTKKEQNEIYGEEMTARVNREGEHHEVILRSVKGAHAFVLRNQPGAKTFRDGVTYNVSFTEATPAEEAPAEK
jgi:hypothetical protein